MNVVDATGMAVWNGPFRLRGGHASDDEAAHPIRRDTGDRVGRHRTTTPRPPADILILAFDYPVTTGPNIPSFALSNDLRGAVRITYDRADIDAMPVRPDIPLTCGPQGVQVGDSGHPEFVTSGAYGATRFVDVGRRRAALVRSNAQCERLLGSYVAGPMVDPTA